MDWLVEVNVALWGFIIPMFGAFNFVQFKRGGPYGPEGTYISNVRALVLLLGTALFSHFILSPMVKVSIETLCSLYPNMKYVLIIIALGILWSFISKSRKRKL